MKNASVGTTNSKFSADHKANRNLPQSQANDNDAEREREKKVRHAKKLLPSFLGSGKFAWRHPNLRRSRSPSADGSSVKLAATTSDPHFHIQDSEDFSTIGEALRTNPERACELARQCPKTLKTELILYLLEHYPQEVKRLPKEVRADFRAMLRMAGRRLLVHRQTEFIRLVNLCPKWAKRKTALLCLKFPQALPPTIAVQILQSTGLCQLDIYRQILRSSQRISEMLTNGSEAAWAWYEEAWTLRQSIRESEQASHFSEPQVIVCGSMPKNLNKQVFGSTIIACYQLSTQFIQDTLKGVLNMNNYSSKDSIGTHAAIRTYPGTVQYTSWARSHHLEKCDALGHALAAQMRHLRHSEERHCTIMLRTNHHAMALDMQMLPSGRACKLTFFDPYRTNVLVMLLVDVNDSLDGITMRSLVDACKAPVGFSYDQLFANEDFILLHVMGVGDTIPEPLRMRENAQLDSTGNCQFTAEALFHLAENNYDIAILKWADASLADLEPEAREELFELKANEWKNVFHGAMELGHINSIKALGHLLERHFDVRAAGSILADAAAGVVSAWAYGNEQVIHAFLDVANKLPPMQRYEIYRACEKISPSFPFRPANYRDRLPPSFFRGYVDLSLLTRERIWRDLRGVHAEDDN